MKILQLNTWTGRLKGSLARFLQENIFDVICLQEAVWCDNPLLENFCLTVDQIKTLSGLEHDFRSANWEIEAFGSIVKQGNVILSRDDFLKTNTYTVHGEYLSLRHQKDVDKQGYTLQVAQLSNRLNLVNHHGYWRPTPMGNETTVEVMQIVAEIIRENEPPIVMCGDLNIIHDSPAMRALDFLRDLTDEYGIDNTLVGLKFDGKVACDHILVSDDIKVQDFQVLDNLVSDHKALVVEI